jgi:hypothetical protein
MAVSDRVRAWLRSPRMPAFMAVLALLLALPSLGLPFQTDDHAVVERLGEGVSPWDLFSSTPDQIAEYRQIGRMSWWTGELSLRFVRPIAVLSHALDHALFGAVAWPMHLVNALLYAVMVALAALAYRRVLGATATAGVAALMFAVDDAHAAAVGWISARNSVLACLFALAALGLHMRGGRARWLSPLSSAAALFSAEAGVSVLPLLLAHALALEDGPLARRLRWLVPHALVAAVWAAVYVALDGGVRDAGWYRDPRAAPFDVLLQGVLDLPVWLWSQLGLSLVSATNTMPVAAVRVACGLLVLPLLLALLPALRSSRPARFFALALLLCLPPLWTTMPQDRVLLSAGFGGFGLIACAMTALAERASALARTGRIALVVLHLALPPLLFVPTMGNLNLIDRAAFALANAVRPDRDAVIVNLPLELLTLYTWQLRRANGQHGPPSLHQLYAGASALKLTRIDTRSLELSAEHGWGHTPIEHVFSSGRRLRALATQPVELRALTARVVATTPDGRPQRVRFTFPTALEENRTWLAWNGKRPAAFALPAIGQSVELPSLQLASSL